MPRSAGTAVCLVLSVLSLLLPARMHAEEGPEKRVRPVAWWGVGEEYVETLDVRWSSGPRGRYRRPSR